MSERVKFDDDASAKGKIATSPDITVDAHEMQKQPVKEPAGKPVQANIDPVRAVPDDPETDARNTRLLNKAVERLTGLDDDTRSALNEFGNDLWPLLRACGMGPGLYAGIIGLLVGAPAAVSGFKVLASMFRKKGEENAAGNS